MKLLEEIKKADPILYNTFLVRLLIAIPIAHFIITFNEPESFFQFFQMPDYYRALLFNVLMATCIIELIHRVTRRLDIAHTWIFRPVMRGGLQILLGMVLPQGLSILLAFSYFASHGIRLDETAYFSEYFPIIFLLVALGNAYYLIHYGYWVISLMRRLKKTRIIRKPILPDDKKDNWPTRDIALICRQGSTTVVFTTKDEQFNWPETLELTINNLPYPEFFLVSRSAIVFLDNIESAEEVSSRRIKLTLNTAKVKEVHSSQRYYYKVREWLMENDIVIN